PEPTTPLGAAPPPGADTTQAAAPATPPPPSTPPPALTQPPPSTPARPAAPDTCWVLQVAAPPERARAEQMRAAAESQLLIPMTIEHEAKRYKVRTRDCMSREAADRLRGRAVSSGFSGAFRVIRK